MAPQNILFIVIDTARADVVHEMMAENHLPALQTLADDGILFRNAITPSPWTLPSHASMFTGQRASDHGTHAGNKRFDPETPTVAECLDSNGYQTYGISGNIWISPEFGFDRGFDRLSMKYERFWGGSNLSGVSHANSLPEKFRKFVSVTTGRTLLLTLANGFYTKLFAGRHDKGAANTTRRTRAWLRRHSDDTEPFFYFINYLEPHLRYGPQEEFVEPFLPDGVSYEEATEVEQDAWGYVAGKVDYTEREFEILRSLYRGELRYIDSQIGKLLTELDEQGLRDETAIIVVGDHGENIGDHDLMDHQYCLYQTLLHVPMIIDGPTVPQREETGLVETRDLFPTMLELAEIPQPADEATSDNSLLDGVTRSTAISEYLAPQPSMDSLRERVGGAIDSRHELDRTLRAVQTDTWKLIESSDGSRELYDLTEDADESRNLAAARTDVVEELVGELDSERIPLSYQDSDDFDVSDASKKRLEDLGYI